MKEEPFYGEAVRGKQKNFAYTSMPPLDFRYKCMRNILSYGNFGPVSPKLAEFSEKLREGGGRGGRLISNKKIIVADLLYTKQKFW